MSTIAVQGNKGTEKNFVKALDQAGFTTVPANVFADALLIDFDSPHHFHGSLIKAYADRGRPVFIIPHGANVNLAGDNIHPVSMGVTGCFVPAKGYDVVMAAYGYPHPVHVVGWPFCPIKTPSLRTSPAGNILFAPIHPSGNGAYPHYLEANRRVFKKLLSLHRPLTVRYTGNFEAQGLWEAPRVEYVKGGNLDTTEIDQADLVVAWGTMLHLAVARGKPTLSFGSDIQVADHIPGQGWKVAERWFDYAEYMRYPFDIEDGVFIKLESAAFYELDEVERWKNLFVGRPLEADQFIPIIKEAL